MIHEMQERMQSNMQMLQYNAERMSSCMFRIGFAFCINQKRACSLRPAGCRLMNSKNTDESKARKQKRDQTHWRAHSAYAFSWAVVHPIYVKNWKLNLIWHDTGGLTTTRHDYRRTKNVAECSFLPKASDPPIDSLKTKSNSLGGGSSKLINWWRGINRWPTRVPQGSGWCRGGDGNSWIIPNT